jgi:hypothetical protein
MVRAVMPPPAVRAHVQSVVTARLAPLPMPMPLVTGTGEADWPLEDYEALMWIMDRMAA